jgi:uncharacterized protein (DUF2141 family)
VATTARLGYQALEAPHNQKIATTMKWSAWGIALCLALGFNTPMALAATPGGKATLIIHVENVLPGGVVRMGVYTEAQYPDDNATPVASMDVPAVPGETTITLHDLPTGTFAVQRFQDVNNNGKMDMTWIGLPLEPFGFSRDATPFLSKPSFDAVKFALAEGDNTITIHLQNMTKPSPADKARDTLRARQRQ